MCISVQLPALAFCEFFFLYLKRHNNKNFMIWLFCVIAFHIGAKRVICPWDRSWRHEWMKIIKSFESWQAWKLWLSLSFHHKPFVKLCLRMQRVSFFSNEKNRFMIVCKFFVNESNEIWRNFSVTLSEKLFRFNSRDEIKLRIVNFKLFPTFTKLQLHKTSKSFWIEILLRNN